jgi:hypothetical protein
MEEPNAVRACLQYLVKLLTDSHFKFLQMAVEL